MQKQCNNNDCIQGSRSKYSCESEKKEQCHEDVWFSVCYIFLVNSVVSVPEKPNILEIRYVTVQYSKDVFIYFSRARMLDLHLQSNLCWVSDVKVVWFNIRLIIYLDDSAAKSSELHLTDSIHFGCYRFLLFISMYSFSVDWALWMPPQNCMRFTCWYLSVPGFAVILFSD